MTSFFPTTATKRPPGPPPLLQPTIPPSFRRGPCRFAEALFPFPLNVTPGACGLPMSLNGLWREI
jgi:hypothetical protein